MNMNPETKMTARDVAFADAGWDEGRMAATDAALVAVINAHLANYPDDAVCILGRITNAIMHGRPRAQRQAVLDDMIGVLDDTEEDSSAVAYAFASEPVKGSA